VRHFRNFAARNAAPATKIKCGIVEYLLQLAGRLTQEAATLQTELFEKKWAKMAPQIDINPLTMVGVVIGRRLLDIRQDLWQPTAWTGKGARPILDWLAGDEPQNLRQSIMRRKDVVGRDYGSILRQLHVSLTDTFSQAANDRPQLRNLEFRIDVTQGLCCEVRKDLNPDNRASAPNYKPGADASISYRQLFKQYKALRRRHVRRRCSTTDNRKGDRHAKRALNVRKGSRHVAKKIDKRAGDRHKQRAKDTRPNAKRT
jgi:hypothetical protein